MKTLIKKILKQVPQIRKILLERNQYQQEIEKLSLERNQYQQEIEKLSLERNQYQQEIEKLSQSPKDNFYILDQYFLDIPSSENAIKIFDGEWSSEIPQLQTGGRSKLFEDTRILLFEKEVGGFHDKNILELGPLEGGHSYMMAQKGAKSVTSIESNARAYLKCLIVKEIFKFNVNFLLGDFDKYLEGQLSSNYDFILASGVIYHCINPLKTLSNITKCSDNIGIWSHYFKKDICEMVYGNRFEYSGNDVEYNGFKAKYFQLSYGDALNLPGFCGGSNAVTHWITKEDWLNFFDFLGFEFKILEEDENHPHGPAFTAIAKKRV